jgi:hypothetical protein
VPLLNWFFMAVVIIIGLDFFLCLGWPQLGVSGIGWAWLAGGLVGMSLNLYLLSKSDLAGSLNLWPAIKGGLDERNQRNGSGAYLKIGHSHMHSRSSLGNGQLSPSFSFSP